MPTGPRSTVGNVSGNRCESDCRYRGCEFDPGPVPYFCGDRSWNNFNCHSPPFRWIIQEGLLSFTSESMCMKYWLTACSSSPRKKSVVRWTDRPTMTLAVDLGRKATKQTNSLWHALCWEQLRAGCSHMLHIFVGQVPPTVPSSHGTTLVPSMWETCDA